MIKTWQAEIGHFPSLLLEESCRNCFLCRQALSVLPGHGMQWQHLSPNLKDQEPKPAEQAGGQAASSCLPARAGLTLLLGCFWRVQGALCGTNADIAL